MKAIRARLENITGVSWHLDKDNERLEAELAEKQKGYKS